jgi:sulfur-oxidizing protein SoxY|tara:strand:- start:1709 stop:2155 length:447 start_codon:yes stop_codon:yes gene_type:complete
MKRRNFLKVGLAVTLSSVLSPGLVLGRYPQKAFDNKNVAGAISALHGSSSFPPSDSIDIIAPRVAKNGKVVPIQVISSIPNTESISLIFESSIHPFLASFNIFGSEAFISTRIKVEVTGNLLVVVKAGGELFSTKQKIQVSADNSCLA